MIFDGVVLTTENIFGLNLAYNDTNENGAGLLFLYKNIVKANFLKMDTFLKYHYQE